MLPIPKKVLTPFNEILKQRAEHETSRIYYRKWLRYFLDFRRKYPPPDTKSEQVHLFLEQLKSKKQTPQQCTQAAHTVSLFFESQQLKNSSASAPAERKSLQSARQENPPLKTRNAKGAVTAGIAGSSTSATTIAEPSAPFATPAGKRYNEWRCQEKTKLLTWDQVIEKLTSVPIITAKEAKTF